MESAYVLQPYAGLLRLEQLRPSGLVIMPRRTSARALRHIGAIPLGLGKHRHCLALATDPHLSSVGGSGHGKSTCGEDLGHLNCLAAMNGLNGVSGAQEATSAEPMRNLTECLRLPDVSCTTFNVLAPIYKRMGSEDVRESQFQDKYMERNRQIADMLVSKGSSIICLQEFWHGSAALRQLYQDKLGGAGYSLHVLCRTGSRGDGLLTAVRRDQLEVLDEQEIRFNDSGDRVALLLRLRASTSFSRAAAARQHQRPMQAPAAAPGGGSWDGAAAPDVPREGQGGAVGMALPPGQLSAPSAATSLLASAGGEGGGPGGLNGARPASVNVTASNTADVVVRGVSGAAAGADGHTFAGELPSGDFVGDAPARGCVEFIVVNTHLTFPHSKSYTLVRLREVFKIIEFLQHYKAGAGLDAMPIVLCGDWNGGKLGQVYKFLRSQGFVSSYDVANGLSDDEESTWVSHRNHRGMEVGVDFIYLLNPSCQLQPLSVDWKETVFSVVKATLYRAGLHGTNELFRFFLDDQARGKPAARPGVEGEGVPPAVRTVEEAAGEDSATAALAAAVMGGAPLRDYITGEEFYRGLCKLNLMSQLSFGLTREEADELIARMDTDGDGLIRKDDFRAVMAGEEEGGDAEADAWARALLDDESGDGVMSGEQYRALAMGIIQKHKQLAKARADKEPARRRSKGKGEGESVTTGNCSNCDKVQPGRAGCGAVASIGSFSSASDSSVTTAREEGAAQGGSDAGESSTGARHGWGSEGVNGKASQGVPLDGGAPAGKPCSRWAPVDAGEQGYYDKAPSLASWPAFDQDDGAAWEDGEDGYGSDEEGEGEGEGDCFRATDFCIKFSKLEPDEMGRGHWPVGYDLSDHAPLTSVFAPMMPLRAVRPRAVPPRAPRDVAGPPREMRGQRECLS